MKKKLERSIKDKTAIAFLSGSAGELDWILPIIDYLLNKGFNIKIIFLTRHSYLSVQKNRMLIDYISKKNELLQTYLCGGYFIEKIEHYCYLVYRISLKLRLSKIPVIKSAYNLISKLLSEAFKYIFLKSLPSEILKLKKNNFLIFSEFPSLRRPRDLWLREEFDKATFIYHPHSPHIYVKNLDKIYSDHEINDYKNKYYLFLGYPGDYYAINDNLEYTASDLQKVFIGHPKYSNSWLQDFREKALEFRSSIKSRNEINILVLSRGVGSYLNYESHTHLVETTIGTVHNRIPNYKLIIKKHPREKKSHWDTVLNKYPSIKIIDDHVLNLATTIDFVITFWSSGAMDCYQIGVPVIEFYDPNKFTKQQYFDIDHYTTIYRKLGLVYPANNKEELKQAISDLIKNNFDNKLINPHRVYTNLINRSNNWKMIMESIISVNDF